VGERNCQPSTFSCVNLLLVLTAKPLTCKDLGDMPATIVVGGQFGSEGKGKVVALLASRAEAPWLVRCGGPNSGHTVTIQGRDVVLRQVPSCSEPSRATFLLSAGCAIDEAVLLRELDLLGIPRDRIVVDPRAVIVTDQDRENERRSLKDIASTCSGTGSAMARRLLRAGDVMLAGDSDVLAKRCRIQTIAPLLHEQLDLGSEVIIEGSQGFALSLLHGDKYPFVTSRDTTASGFASEVGLAPRMIDRVVVVVRTFPIRVGGPSGPFHSEISWERICELSGAPTVVPEFTSVTRKLRRVAHFDLDAVKRACDYNRPTSLAVMGLDRLDYKNQGVTKPNLLSQSAKRFLKEVEDVTGVPVEFGGTGFGTFDVVLNPTISFELELTCQTSN
jgi:adenylosuccinate synthase